MSTIDLWGSIITLVLMVTTFGGMALANARARSATREVKEPLLGASFGLVDNNDQGGILAACGTGQRAALCGSLLGGLGGVVGLPVGGAVGTRAVYRFEGRCAGKPRLRSTICSATGSKSGQESP